MADMCIEIFRCLSLKKSEDLGRFANVYSTHGEQVRAWVVSSVFELQCIK